MTTIYRSTRNEELKAIDALVAASIETKRQGFALYDSTHRRGSGNRAGGLS